MTTYASEQALYAELWSSVSTYAEHAPGVTYLPLFLQMVQPGDRRAVTVLDAGTGSGKGALALHEAGFDVRACDVTPAGIVPEAFALIPYYNACLWHDISHITRAFGHPSRTKADYVYCTDVLEHIPTHFTMLAMRNLLNVATHGVFCSVALRQDNFGIWMGRQLHLTVQSFTWWRDAFNEIGTVVEARDLISDAVFLVKSR